MRNDLIVLLTLASLSAPALAADDLGIFQRMDQLQSEVLLLRAEAAKDKAAQERQLSAAETDKKLRDLRLPPPPPGMPGSSMGTPMPGFMGQNQPPAAPASAPALPQVNRIMQMGGAPRAVLALPSGGEMEVSVGDELPDGSRVERIALGRVEISQMKDKKTVSRVLPMFSDMQPRSPGPSGSAPIMGPFPMGAPR